MSGPRGARAPGYLGRAARSHQGARLASSACRSCDLSLWHVPVGTVDRSRHPTARLVRTRSPFAQAESSPGNFFRSEEALVEDPQIHGAIDRMVDEEHQLW